MNNKLAIGVIAGLGIIIIVLSVALVMVMQSKQQEPSRVSAGAEPVDTMSPEQAMEISPSAAMDSSNTAEQPDTNQVEEKPEALEQISYPVGEGWTESIQGNMVTIRPVTGGGYILISAFSKTSSDLKTAYCDVANYQLPGKCSEQTALESYPFRFTTGYLVTNIDNSGGGTEYVLENNGVIYIVNTFLTTEEDKALESQINTRIQETVDAITLL